MINMKLTLDRDVIRKTSAYVEFHLKACKYRPPSDTQSDCIHHHR